MYRFEYPLQIVVDTSVIVAVLAQEPSRPRLIAATAGVAFVAPASLHWEFGNALTARLRRGTATLAVVQTMLSNYHKIPIRTADVSIERVLQIAADFGLYAYDAYMIACAKKYRLPLLTLDAKLSAAATDSGVSILEW